MARQRRTSAVLEAAKQRLAGLKKIIPAPNLGPNLSIGAYEAAVDSFTTRLDNHNQILASADDSTNVTKSEENGLNELNRRYLSAVEAQYGPDSSEYEMSAARARVNARNQRAEAPAGLLPRPRLEWRVVSLDL